MKTNASSDQSLAEIQGIQADALVRVGPLMSVPALLREFDCPPEQILGEAGLNLAQFEDPDTRISFLAGSKRQTHSTTADQ